MADFRWILLGLGIVLLVGIWWWGARRSRQAPGDAQMRESTASITPPLHPTIAQVDTTAAQDSAEWGVPPFEPLSIRTADFEELPQFDMSIRAHSEPFDDTLDMSIVDELPQVQAHLPPEVLPQVPPQVFPHVSPQVRPAAALAVAVTKVTAAPPVLENTDPASADALNGIQAQEPNASEQQRIVSVRVCALGETVWPGADLMAVLEELGLAHGRYQVFHRKHSDGRTLFCAASLVEPGTFDVAKMPNEEFRGLTLFAVLPGPAEPLQTVDALLSTAEDLAHALHGTVQISKGVPWSDESIEILRQDVARFQASMTG